MHQHPLIPTAIEIPYFGSFRKYRFQKSGTSVPQHRGDAAGFFELLPGVAVDDLDAATHLEDGLADAVDALREWMDVLAAVDARAVGVGRVSIAAAALAALGGEVLAIDEGPDPALVDGIEDRCKAGDRLAAGVAELWTLLEKKPDQTAQLSL